MENKEVIFKTGLQSKYDSITPDPDTVYFITDTQRLYKGSTLMSPPSSLDVPIDSELSGTSTNPVQNKVVKEHFDKVQDILADGKLKDIICFTSEQEATDGQYLEYVLPNGKFKQGLLDKEFYIMIFAVEEPIIHSDTVYQGIYVVTKNATIDVGHIPELVYMEGMLTELQEKVKSHDGTISQLSRDYPIITQIISNLNSVQNEMRDNMPIEIKESIYPVGIIIQFADNLDHSSFLGFTWERCLVGRFPIGSSSDFSVGTQGGNSQITITPEHLPKLQELGTLAASTSSGKYAQHQWGSNGSPINIIPPYEVVSYWKRVK